MPPKREAFTTAEKVALRARKRTYIALTQRELAQWFTDEFGKSIAQNSVSEILSDRYKHLDSATGPPNAEKQRQELYPNLERALYT